MLTRIHAGWFRLFDILQGENAFIFPKTPRLALGASQLPVRWIMGAFSQGVKRQGREADHSLAYSMELKKEWNFISIYPFDFIIVTISSGRI